MGRRAVPIRARCGWKPSIRSNCSRFAPRATRSCAPRCRAAGRTT